MQRSDQPAFVCEYNPRWPHDFDTIRRFLQPAVEPTGAVIEHVGSTAVPGLAAKPIIDVDIVVPTATDREAYVSGKGPLIRELLAANRADL